jgi:transcriptional regulator with XRE-family HTH domain
MMSIIYKIKDRINEGMQMRQMTASELAAKAGMNKSSLSRYLSGETIPRSLAINKIAQALNVSPAWLLGYDLTPEGEPIIRVDMNKLTEPNRARLLAYYQALLDAQEGGDGRGST